MITLSILAALYFLPTIVAAHRGRGVAGILLLNLFFGWTVIGWFALMVWALLATPHYIVMPCAPQYAYPPLRRY